MVAATKEIGAAPYVGDGKNHWPTVHVVDLANLYVRALEQAPAGSLFHSANATALQVRKLAEAISQAASLTGRVFSWTYEQTQDRLGFLSGHFLLDQQVKSERAQHILGWHPTQLDAIDELTRGSYKDK